VLDGENQQLKHRVAALYWGLLAAGRVRVAGAGIQLTGSHADDGIGVRQVGDLDPVINVHGSTPTERTDPRTYRPNRGP
jgi:hypothetical protein